MFGDVDRDLFVSGCEFLGGFFVFSVVRLLVFEKGLKGFEFGLVGRT